MDTAQGWSTTYPSVSPSYTSPGVAAEQGTDAALLVGAVDRVDVRRARAADAQVEAAARGVGAIDMISRLPGGFLHQVSERGRNLTVAALAGRAYG